MMEHTAASTLLKASDLVRSIVGRNIRNAPLIISSAVVFGALALTPGFIVPQYVNELKWAFAALCACLTIYALLLHWFASRPVRAKLWYVKCIGADERVLLAQYLIEDRTCGYVSVLDATACALLAKGILVDASSLVPSTNAPVLIDAYVYRYMKRNPEAVGLTKDKIASAPKPPTIAPPRGQLLPEDE